MTITSKARIIEEYLKIKDNNMGIVYQATEICNRLGVGINEVMAVIDEIEL